MGNVKDGGRRNELWEMWGMVGEGMDCRRKAGLIFMHLFFFFFWSRKYLSAYHYLGSVLGRVLHEDFEGRELGLIWIYHVTVS